MEVRIYDKNLNLKGIIENQTSLIWTRKYNEAGNFELHVPITDANRKLIQLENLVFVSGAVEAGIIEYIVLDEETGKNEITVSGRFLEAYMDRRITKATKNYSGRVEEIMRTMLSVDTVAIPRVELGTLNGFTDTVAFQATYKNLLTYMSKLGKQANIGFRFKPDFNNKKIVFDTYKGTDHSISQSTANRVIFSEQYENLNKAVYTLNNQSYRTVIYVGGSGEGSDRVIVSVGSGEGLELREFFYSATDITKEDGMTDAAYENALRQRGYEQLDANALVESFECETEPDINFKYKVDYDLGDIVTVRKKSWELTTDLRITEIQEIYEYGSLTVVPTLGTPLPDAIDWEDK